MRRSGAGGTPMRRLAAVALLLALAGCACRSDFPGVFPMCGVGPVIVAEGR